VRWHTDCEDLILLAKLLKLKRVVALMPIKDKQAMSADRTRLCVSIKVLKLRNPKLFICLSVVTDCNHLVA
jgi:hypothetical protein